jgi:hypothetical protein
MPEEFYKQIKINVEDEWILAFAMLINRQHTFLAEQMALEVDALLSKTQDLTKLNKENKQHLSKLLAVQDILRNENISEAENPYGTYTVAQRLYYLNQDILAAIKDIREQTDLTDKSKQELLNQKYEKLKSRLILNSNSIKQEILDIANRRAVIEELYEAYKARGLLDQIEVDLVSQRHYYFCLTTGMGEIAASATKVILMVTRHIGALYESMPLFAGTFALFGTLATLIVSGYQITTNKDNIELHQAVNMLATLTAGFLNVSAHILDAVKNLGSTDVAQHLVWSPFVGTSATLLLLGVEVGNIVRAEVKFNQDRKLFNKLFIDTKNTDWLSVGTILTQSDLELKYALLSKISIKEVNKHPQAIRSLFTEEEFFKYLMPRLLEHSKMERNKLFIRHSTNASISMALMAVGVVAFCIPAIGQIIAVSVISFVIASFIAKLIIYNTLLKEQPFTSIKEMQAQVLQQDVGVYGKLPQETGIDAKLAKCFSEKLEAALELGLMSDLYFETSKKLESSDTDTTDTITIDTVQPESYLGSDTVDIVRPESFLGSDSGSDIRDAVDTTRPESYLGSDPDFDVEDDDKDPPPLPHP